MVLTTSVFAYCLAVGLSQEPAPKAPASPQNKAEATGQPPIKTAPAKGEAEPEEKPAPPAPKPQPPAATAAPGAAETTRTPPALLRGASQVMQVKPTDLEKIQQPGIWTFDAFAYVQPRMITVNVPGRGRRLLWYMVYRVANHGDEPRFFMPEFVLVTDTAKTYRDVIVPAAERAIQALSDPLQPLANSVNVVGNIEPNNEEGINKSVYGVAIWDGVDPKTDQFSIFVAGLSNGFKTLEEVGADGVKTKKVLRKTLELQFARPSDEFLQNSREIRPLGQRWVYR